ncbi:autotransporter-associated beta strand repeat-containing protein, partial [bacterium]|nr:autotransporter-associated beta strand repeat-containing protein [bacterium]
MFRFPSKIAFVCLGVLLSGTTASLAQRQMERLGRGMTALRSNSTQVYVGWRLLGNDPQEVAFNLYRSANGAAAVKLNGSPLAATTDYLDTPPSLGSISYSYSIRPVINSVEVPDTWANALSAPATLPANPPTRQYTPVTLQATPDGALDVKFCWVGDLDGDGEFDFVVDRQSGEGFRQFLEAYKRDGTLLWRIDLGPNSFYKYNIEPGSSSISIGHGDNVTVYDMDGDGKAEVLLRTANGVVFGNGAVVSGGSSNNVQFLSVIDGLTGAELARATAPNPRLADGPMNGHMGILYLDGKRPSVVWAAKNRAADESFHGVITTWDWRNNSLTQRWSWVDDGSIHSPEGHQIRIADVDNDGKDEFVEIGFVIDDNGTQLFNVPEMVHGDRFHVTDIDPDRPGLENFIIQQNNGTGLATAIFDVGTGSMIRKWYAGSVVDVGRGVAGDFDPAVKGCEFFSTQGGIYDCKGNLLPYANKPFPPEAIWWDSDLVREFVSTIGSSATSPGIDKFNTANGSSSRVTSLYSDAAAPNSPYNNYIAYGGRPQFWGDILGDWREELLCVASDHSELRIYSARSPDSAKSSNGGAFRIPTLMHNPQYRAQTTTKGYVQSSYTDFYLGTGMTPPPPPPMVDAKLVWRGGAGTTTWDAGAAASWQNNGVNSTFANGDGVRFDIGADATTAVALNGTLQPAAVTVYTPKNFVFDGSAGSLAGAMTLMKAGSSSLTLSGNHSFSGKTTVWDGAFVMNGSLSLSPLTVWGGTWGGTLTAGLAGGRVAGTGTFSKPVTLAYRGGVTPGAGMGNAGTLSFAGGLTAQDGCYFAMDLSNDPSGFITPSDKVVITGNLSLGGKIGLVVKPLGGTLAPGTYTLITYTGALTGNVSNFAVTVPAGTPYTLAAAAGAVTLTVPVTRAPAAIVWRGSAGTWDLATSQNWLKSGSPDIFVSGDTVTFDATGSASPTATLTGAMPVAGITVNAATHYTFTGPGSISGPGGLTKSGTGTLTLNTVNDYTGPTTITGGVLAIDTLGDAGSPGSIGAATAAASNLVINGGTLRLTGTQTNTNRNLTLGASGGTLDVVTSSSSMQISGVASGTGRLTKAGAGTVILASANTYGGGTSIDGGTIYLAGSNANKNALGSGAVTLNNGTLTMANVQNNDVCNWNLIVPVGATGRLNADGRCSLNGTLTGAGNFTYYSPYVRTDLKGNWSAFTGRIDLATDADGSEMRVTNSSGFGTAALNLGAESFVYYNITNSSPTLDIGELTGDATTGIGGGPTAGRTVTWRVGGRNTDATFSGAIVNSTGTTAIIKNGTGIWTLAGASTHTGATTVGAGTLRITGSTTGSAVTVQSSAALGGTGTITGNVTIVNGGILEHGAAGGTPLAIAGNLTFGTSAVMRPLAGVAITPGTYTVLTYTGTLTGNPALSWQAPAGSTLVATFSTATVGAITMTLSQPLGAADLTWTGNNNFSWDTATANWNNGSNVVFANGSIVSFTETGIATSAINIALDVEPASVTVDAAKNYTLTGVGRIAGTADVEKTGTGTLTLGSANTYTGGTTISGGTLAITHVAALGTGPVTLAGGSWSTGSLSPQNAIIVTANSTISGGDGGGLQGLRNISGNGILTLNATNVFDLEGDMSGFSGTFALTGVNGFRLFTSTFNGSATATFDLGTRGLSARQGSAYNLGALKGLPGSALRMAGNNNSASCTYTIGAANIDSGFAGVITNGSATKLVHIAKTGTGNLTLAGVNTYTGATTVSAGKLIVTG